MILKKIDSWSLGRETKSRQTRSESVFVVFSFPTYSENPDLKHMCQKQVD